MAAIPNYALYGERMQPIWHDALHVESISLRSGAHHWEIAPHRHEGLLQLLYLQHGSGQLRFVGQVLRVQAPCAIIVPAPIVHGFSWDGAVEGQVITAVQTLLQAMADAVSAPLAARLLQAQVVDLPTWPAAADPLLPLFTSLRDEYHNRASDHVASSMGLLLGLLVQVLRHGRCPQGVDEAPASRRSQQMVRFRELVDMHFRQHRPLQAYARELGMTLVTLGRLCQEHLGMPPMALINARLVLEARRELAYSSLSIKAIGHGLGFNDVAYFSRFFRKHTGLSPSQYREQT